MLTSIFHIKQLHLHEFVISIPLIAVIANEKEYENNMLMCTPYTTHRIYVVEDATNKRTRVNENQNGLRAKRHKSHKIFWGVVGK